MKLCDINPHIRYAAIHYYHICRSSDSICYDCRLFFIKEGKGRIAINGCEHAYSGNTALFFPAGTKYHFYPEKNSSFVCTVINFDLVNDFSHLTKSLGTASEQDFDPGRLITYPAPEEFTEAFLRTSPSSASLLDKCCEEFLVQNPLYREISSAFLKLCLLDLIRIPDSKRESAKILPILAYIHENFADISLTNESLARKFSYHPNYLNHLIRQHSGQSLHQYLISYRVKMAKKMLITTDDPINAIAWKSGFNSPSYFAAQFRARVGTTPNTYRKEHAHFLF